MCGLCVSISEEDPSPLRSEAEVKGGAKISRTFSYLRSKMSKKSKVRIPETSCFNLSQVIHSDSRNNVDVFYDLLGNVRESLWHGSTLECD